MEHSKERRDVRLAVAIQCTNNLTRVTVTHMHASAQTNRLPNLVRHIKDQREHI